MKKLKQKRLKITMCAFLCCLLLVWIFCPNKTEAAIENIEALEKGESDIDKICPEAGGYCKISNEHSVYGISMEP